MLLLVVGFVSLPAAGRWLLWKWEQNPILRGRLLAEEAGCLSCHQPFKKIEIPNPGSRWGTIPAFQSGNPMMYDSSDRQGIEEYIRDGAPQSWLSDPEVVKRLSTQHVRMPAYGDLLSDIEIADLVAFVGAIEKVELPDGTEVSAGRDLAVKHGCLSCHGVEGSGGLPNPGSLGGFIPGFLGRNFTDLVSNEDEFRQWILEGSLPRLEKNPLVRYFWQRQKLIMPAYKGELSDEELLQLWAWVLAVRSSLN